MPEKEPKYHVCVHVSPYFRVSVTVAFKSKDLLSKTVGGYQSNSK